MGSVPPDEPETKLLAVIDDSIVALDEVYADLRRIRLRREATWIAESIGSLQRQGDPIDRVRHAISILRKTDNKLVDMSHSSTALRTIAEKIRHLRRRLSFYADPLLEDTQRLSTGEYISRDDDP